MLQDIPFKDLLTSPLNPRRIAPTPEELDTLAASIGAEGLLQNLVARPSPNTPGKYEIVAGATRCKAYVRLCEQGRASPDDLLPVRVIDPCSDRRLLELAMAENLERKDLHPLDEAEGYAQLRRMGAEVKEIAARVGFTARHVQLRLQLADNLTDAVKRAFRDGKLPLASVRIIAATCPTARQAAVLERIEDDDWEYTRPDELQRMLRAEAIPLEHALFERTAYDGAVQVDVPELDEEDSGWELDKDTELAADIELFWKLQNEAIEARRAELARDHAEVKVIRDRHYWQPYNDGLHVGNKDKATAIAVIVVAKDGQVREFTKLGKDGGGSKTKSGTRGAKAGTADRDKKDQTGDNTLPTRAGQVIAKHAKTRALRAAMVSQADPHIGTKAAMIAAIIGLMGEHGVARLGTRDEYRGVDNAIAAPEVEQVLDRHRGRLRDFVSKDKYGIPGGPGSLDVKHGKAGALYRALAVWDLADVMELFTALVAASVGTWPDNDPRLGDDEVAIAMADHLRPDVAAVWTCDDAYARALRKPGLLRALDDMGIDAEAEGLAKKKTGELVDSVVHVARHVDPPYLPPLLRFGTEADVRKAIKPGATLAPPPPAEPPAAPPEAPAETPVDLTGLIGAGKKKKATKKAA